MAELLETFGAEVVWSEPMAGMKGAIEMAERLGQGGRASSTHASSKAHANLQAHYETTGPEILDALPSVDAFVAGIGTGGTLTGVGRRLRERNPATRIVGVESKMGEQLQGLRNLQEGYVPPLLDLNMLSGRFLVDTEEAFRCARSGAGEGGHLRRRVLRGCAELRAEGGAAHGRRQHRGHLRRRRLEVPVGRPLA